MKFLITERKVKKIEEKGKKIRSFQHRDIKHCFLVLSRDFSQYGSCAGSFYQEQKMANIGEFKIVSSEIP